MLFVPLVSAAISTQKKNNAMPIVIFYKKKEELSTQKKDTINKKIFNSKNLPC
jgi:hypothetical protein